jgi:acetyl-CoA decarbonylase/synthase, CODH/ACS complex subunit gamma
MAVTGLDIFKKLPKTNCGECGVPTCMAFAMKLAARQVEVDKCPYISEDAKAELSEASAAPIKKITIGAGDYAFNLGEETVLFRHEKTFVNPAVFGLVVDDSDEGLAEKVKKADAIQFERIEQQLRPRVVAVRNGSGSADKFAAAVAAAAENTKLPLVLMADDPAVVKGALDQVKANRPLLYGANSSNFSAWADLAKETGLPLAVRGESLEELADTVEKLVGAGVKDIVLAPGATTAVEGLKELVHIRRAALKQKFKPLGFPTVTFPGYDGQDSDTEFAMAGLHLMKYGGLILLNDMDPAKVLPLLVLQQNIYTDPQKPMQMSEGIYPVGEPTADSPVMITTNFSLTYFIVSGEIEASRVPTWLLVMDVEGLSVLTAWAAGKFVPERIAQFVNKSGITDKVSHKDLVLPGYVAQISGELEEELSDWKITVGPREAGDVPHYLKSLSN